MAAKKKPAVMAKPARARKLRIAGKSALGAKLQAIADDTKVRSPCHAVCWRDRAGDGKSNGEGGGLYWGQGAMMTPATIGRRRCAKLREAAV